MYFFPVLFFAHNLPMPTSSSCTPTLWQHWCWLKCKASHATPTISSMDEAWFMGQVSVSTWKSNPSNSNTETKVAASTKVKGISQSHPYLLPSEMFFIQTGWSKERQIQSIHMVWWDPLWNLLFISTWIFQNITLSWRKNNIYVFFFN